jgi:hypothetical protein
MFNAQGPGFDPQHLRRNGSREERERERGKGKGKERTANQLT